MKSFRFPRASAALIAIVFLSAAGVTAPQLMQLGLEAAELAGKSYSARREKKMGFYAAVRDVRRSVPESESVPIILARLEDLDVGVFVNFYLYPRPSQLYAGLQPYKGIHIQRSPRILVRIDGRRPVIAEKMTYEQIRREQMEVPIVTNAEAAADYRRAFFVPLVGSVDGAGKDSFTTEAILVSDKDAVVTLTLLPANEQKQYSLSAHEPLHFIDLVDQSFGRLTTGWLRVTSSAPLRGNFWLVNRGLRVAAALPQVETAPPLPQRFSGGEKLWILNPHDVAIAVRINGVEHIVRPYGLSSVPAEAINDVEGDSPAFVFTSRRTAKGNTEFDWPENRP